MFPVLHPTPPFHRMDDVRSCRAVKSMTKKNAKMLPMANRRNTCRKRMTVTLNAHLVVPGSGGLIISRAGPNKALLAENRPEEILQGYVIQTWPFEVR